MRYLSLLIIFAAMKFSWAYIHSNEGVSEVTHVGIQTDLKQFISDYIREQIPSSKNVKFDRFWTTNLKEGLIKVSFLYSFEEDIDGDTSAQTSIEGHALLTQQNADGGDHDIWALEELNILNNKVDFKDGITIKSDPNAQ